MAFAEDTSSRCFRLDPREGRLGFGPKLSPLQPSKVEEFSIGEEQRPSSGNSEDIVRWLERELLARLERIDQRLEALVSSSRTVASSTEREDGRDTGHMLSDGAALTGKRGGTSARQSCTGSARQSCTGSAQFKATNSALGPMITSGDGSVAAPLSAVTQLLLANAGQNRSSLPERRENRSLSGGYSRSSSRSHSRGFSVSDMVDSKQSNLSTIVPMPPSDVDEDCDDSDTEVDVYGPKSGPRSGWASEGQQSNAPARASSRQHSAHSSERSLESIRSCAVDEIMHENMKTRHTHRQQLWSLLNIPESSWAALWYARGMSLFIMASVVFTLLRTVEPQPIGEDEIAAIEVLIDTMFVVEILLRFLAAQQVRNFFQSSHNIIDLLAVAPRVLEGVMLVFQPFEFRGTLESFVLCSVLVLRLLKLTRRFEKFRLILSAIDLVLEAIPVCLYAMLILTVVFSSLIFIVEPRDNIGSLSTAMWLAIVTMTTVGYGDVTPVSPAGSIIVAWMVVCAVFYTAMPVGVIGNAFAQVWMDRDRILLMQRTKEHLLHMGFKACDMESLFGLFDTDGNGSLEFEEFVEAMKTMKLGLSDRRALTLFESIDIDNSGSIESKEFVKAMFPDFQLQETGETNNEASETVHPTGIWKLKPP